MRYLLSRSRFVCWLRLRRFVTYLSMWGCVSFWVEANTFTVWDWGYALPSELKQIRLLIEYAGIRSLLSRIKFVWWLSMCGCVPFWVEANSFTDWDWGDSLPFEWKQIRFLIEKWGCVSFWVETKFVYWLRLRGCVTFWVKTDSFADWVCGDAFPFE